MEVERGTKGKREREREEESQRIDRLGEIEK